MATTDIDTLSLDNPNLILKFKRFIVLIAPEDAEIPLSLTEGTPPQLSAPPADYVSLGLLRKGDGIEFGVETESEDVESIGYGAPTRTDIDKETLTAGLTPQESKRAVHQLYYGLNIAGNIADPTTGEVKITRPILPPTMYVRAYFIGRDRIGAKEVLMGVLWPRTLVTSKDSQSAGGADEYAYPMTLQATPDPELGTPEIRFFGGQGWKALGAATGYTPSTP